VERIAGVARAVVVVVGLARVRDRRAVVVVVDDAVAVRVRGADRRLPGAHEPGLDGTRRVAAVVARVVAVVARLAVVDHAVAAQRRLRARARLAAAQPAVLDRALVVAAVADVGPGVVALLGADDEAVATDRRAVARRTGAVPAVLGGAHGI